MKRLLGFVICFLIAVQSVPFAGISAYAVEDSDQNHIYKLSFGEPSQYGYSDYKWVDENGNTVDIEENVCPERQKSLLGLFVFFV